MPTNSPRFIPVYIALFITSFLPAALCVQPEQEALSEIQRQARIYRNQGRQNQKEGRLDAALTLYQKAFLLDPDFAVAYNDAGVILEAQGMPERAKELYLKAIEVAPDYPNSYSNLAIVYESEGDYANAVLCWVKRATLGSPDDPWAEAARKRLEDIARAYPQAFRNIGDQYRESLKQQGAAGTVVTGAGYIEPQASPNISLFGTSSVSAAGTAAGQPDNKTRALSYLARAKESFSRSDYVAALKDATLAEYLDSSNEEVSSFVEKVRRVLLQ